MKELSEKTIKVLEIVSGLVLGLATWGLLILSSKATDQLLQYSWLALFAGIMFGSKKIEKKTERQLKTFRLFLIISLGIGLLMFILLAFVFKVI